MQKIPQVLTLVLLISFLFFFQSTFSQNFDRKEYPVLDSVRGLITNAVNRGKAASVSIGILKNGKIVWKESFGWADIQKKIKATSQTVYPLASLTKSITSTTAYILASEGKLNFKEPANKYLSSAKLTYYNCDSNDLKVFHLTNMLGGIPHVVRYYYTDQSTHVPSVKDQIQSYGFTAYQPGTVFNYSNFSLAIIDQIITDVAKEDFADYTQQALFSKLDMQHSYADKKLIPLKEFVSTGYTEGKRVADNRFEPRGGAGAYSCIDDLLKYGYFHIHNKIINGNRLIQPQAFEEMHTPVSSLNPYYSNGWGVLKIEDSLTSLLSNGAIAGCASSLLLLPDKDVVIACLTNSTLGNDFTDDLAFTCASAFQQNYLQRLHALIEKATPFFEDHPFDSKSVRPGTYNGFVRINQHDIPAKLEFDTSGKIFFSVGKQKSSMLADVRAASDLFIAQTDLTSPDTTITQYKDHVSLQVQLTEDKINGIVQAESDEDYPLFVLPYYIELKRKE